MKKDPLHLKASRRRLRAALNKVIGIDRQFRETISRVATIVVITRDQVARYDQLDVRFETWVMTPTPASESHSLMLLIPALSRTTVSRSRGLAKFLS